uniref:Uncharacterized protein n=1 Tax=Pseudomonas phage Cygsa01 TaxID=3138529 RepID=A0AAU6W422_9VIRU
MKSEVLKLALESRIPEIEERYTKMLTFSFEKLVERFGDDMNNIENSGSYTFWSTTMRRVCMVTNPVEHCRMESRDGPARYALNPEALARAAKAYATETVMAWLGKIQAKMGDLEKAECLHVDGCRFAIIGVRGNNNVRIDQDMIINVSSKGTMYNQYPARIYVNRKFMSEANYKKMFM